MNKMSKRGKKMKKGLDNQMEAIAQKKEVLSELVIHHTRDESHKIDICVPTFTIQEGGKTLFEEAELNIHFGKRYVLIGRNGIGKTTLFNAIAAKELEGIPKHLQILHVEQESVANENVSEVIFIIFRNYWRKC
jgi:ABC-type molybdenum transport system ATPase subunit/photorepair protein PhrA